MKLLLKRVASTSLGLLLAASPLSASAADVRVTVTNLTTSNQGAFSAVVLSAHDGSVDQFDLGGAASMGVEQVAELGVGGIATQTGEILAQQASAVVAPTANADGSVTGFPPGVSQSVVLSGLDAADNRYLSYLSMFVPSNDTFIGNDNPLAIELFDAAGNFIAADFTLTGANLWDAGTEVNGLLGAAFLQNQDVTISPEEGGVVTRTDLDTAFDFYVGETTNPGFAFSGGPTADQPIIAFSFELIPEPAAATLVAFGVVAAAARRKH